MLLYCITQHDIEPAQNQKLREPSGAALKNKKKRESKARSKQEKETQVGVLLHVEILRFVIHNQKRYYKVKEK